MIVGLGQKNFVLSRFIRTFAVKNRKGGMNADAEIPL